MIMLYIPLFLMFLVVFDIMFKGDQVAFTGAVFMTGIIAVIHFLLNLSVGFFSPEVM